MPKSSRARKSAMRKAKCVWIGLIAVNLVPIEKALSYERADKIRVDENASAQWAVLGPQLERLDAEMYFTCARNALYVFLICLPGHIVPSFEEVKEAVPVKAPYGTSMKALLEAAIKLGCNAEIRLYSPGDCNSIPLPAIVHTTAGRINEIHHFDVMYKRDREWLYLINGTTSKPYKIRHSRFGEGDWWTGYALIRKRSLFTIMLDKYWPHVVTFLLVSNGALLARSVLRMRRP